MHIAKRIIASVLVAAMLLSELPTAVLAEMLDPEQVTEAAEISEPALEETGAAVPEEEDTFPPEDLEESGSEDVGALEGAESSTESVEETGTSTEVPATDPEAPPATEEEPLATESPKPSEGPQDELDWFVDDDGVLTITGVGHMNETDWMDYYEEITAVVIGEGVISVCEEAFAGYPALEQVMLPDSLETICAGAFRDCVNLREIYIPGGVRVIKSGAFSGCVNLRTIRIYSYDIFIADDALTGVNAMVGRPYDAPLDTSRNYGGTISWSNYGTQIATGLYGAHRWAIDEGGYLEIFGIGTMEAQSSAEEYPWYPYAGNIQSLSSGKLDNLPEYAFAGYPILHTAYIGVVDSIDAAAFSGCSNLKTIQFSNCPSYIAEDAFTGVTATVNYLPEHGWTEEDMRGYGGDLTWDCVYTGNYGENVNWEVVSGVLSIYPSGQGTQHMEDQSSAAAYPWYAHREKVHTAYLYSVSAGDYCFDGYTALQQVEINQPGTIGEYAFRNCTGLKKIAFQGDPPEIAATAFTGVTANAQYNSYYGWTAEDMQDYGGDLTWSEIVYEEPELASGTHGDNSTWTLGTGGTLTVRGEGEMAAAEVYPWQEYRDLIRNVTVSGLSSVSDGAFAGLASVDNVTFAPSVTRVGSRILDGTAAQWVEFQGAPPAFAEDTFAGLSYATLLYPYSCRDLWTEEIRISYGGTEVWWSQLTHQIAGGRIGAGYWSIQEDGYMHFNSEPYGNTFTLPESENGTYPWSTYGDFVTGLDLTNLTNVPANAFRNFTAIEFVTIPDTVTYVGAQAFAGCTALQHVTFRGYMDSVAEDAFTGVTATVIYYTDEWTEEKRNNYGGTLTWEKGSMWIDGGMLDGIYWDIYSDGSLSMYADEIVAMPSFASAEVYPWYEYRDMIREISVSNVTSIGDYAFAGCVNLESFLFPYCIESLGNNIFEGCTNLEFLYFHGDAPEFSENTFYGVTATVAEYPRGNETWTEDLLQDYGGNITWPGEGEQCPHYPVTDEAVAPSCTESGLTEGSHCSVCGQVLVAQTVIPAEGHSYEVQELVVPTCTTGGYTAYSCSVCGLVTTDNHTDALGHIEVTEPEEEPGCMDHGMTEGVYCDRCGQTLVERMEIPPVGHSYDFVEVTDPTCTEEGYTTYTCFRCGDSYDDDFMPPEGHIYEDGVCSVCGESDPNYQPNENCGEELNWNFEASTGILTISGYGDMWDYSFELGAPWAGYGEQITGIALENGVTSIGAYAFSGLAGVTYVTMGDMVQSVGSGAFMDCGSLGGVVLPGSVEYIGFNAFAGCSALESFMILDSDNPEFETMFAGANEMGASVFNGCINLTTVTLGNTVKSIPDGVFSGSAVMQPCTGLVEINFSDSLRSIGSCAFMNCSSLKNVTLPGSVEHIGFNAFAGCSGLESFTILDNENQEFETVFAGANEMGASVFDGCINLTTVNLGNTVKSVPNGVFSGAVAIQPCAGLVEINFSDSLRSIGSCAFMNCSSLKNVTLPGSVEHIGFNAFAGCSGLESFAILDNENPEFETMFAGANEMGASIFDGCINLTTVNLGNTVKSVPNGVFSGSAVFQPCAGLAEVNFSDSLRSIGSCAFMNCSSLQAVTLPGSVEHIGFNAFAGCTGLESFTILDNDNPEFETMFAGANEIGTSIFDGCINLTTVNLGNTVKSIPNGVFSGGAVIQACTGLAEINFSKSLRSIGSCAFMNCSSLHNVALPYGVEFIGDYAFSGCTGLRFIHIPNTVETFGEECLDSTVTVYAHGDSPAAQMAGERGLNLIEAKHVYLYDKCIYCGGDVLPGGICGENLNWTFDDATGTLTISGTGDMEDYTENTMPWYDYLYGIRKLELEEGVTGIGQYAVYGCRSLTELVCPDSLRSIRQYSFQDCDALASVDFNEGLEEIRGYSFYRCTELTEISIPDSVTYIGGNAFRDCTGLTGTLVIPRNASLGASAFSYCDGLTSLVIRSGGSMTIGSSAFAGCNGLTTVELSNSVTGIGEHAFMSCTGLTSIEIPETVTTIDARAFRFCSNLTQIRMLGDAPTIGTDAFMSVTATVLYPASNSTWTKSVMQNYGGTLTWEPYLEVIDSGWCGMELEYTLTEDGTLTISGTGEMDYYDGYMMMPPWQFYTQEMKRIVLEEGVTTVSDNAFRDMFENVTEIVFPDSLISIGDEAFAGCINVEELHFGSGLESIGSYAFVGSNAGGTLVLPDSMKTVGEAAFQGCSNFTGLDLGEGVEVIEDRAFGSCTGITGELVFPASLKQVGRSVFGFSSNVTNVRFERVDCPTFADNPLKNMSNLKQVYVPAENYESYEALLAQLPDSVEILTDANAFPVTGLRVTANYGMTIVLAWDAHQSGKAVSYTVFRDGVEVATVTECTYADRPLEEQTQYSYTVCANFAGGPSAPAEESVSAATVAPEITSVTGFLEYGGVSKVAEGHSTILITVPDKGNLAPLGDRTFLAELYYNDGETDHLVGYAQKDAEKSTADAAVYSIEWDVSTLSDGEYSILVVVWDVDLVGAEWSRTVTVDNTPPAKLQQLITVGSESAINLSWPRAVEFDTRMYRIYRAAGEEGSFELLAQIDDPATLSYTDTIVEKDIIYRYYVVGVDLFGRESNEYDIVRGSLIQDTAKPRVVQMQPASGSRINGSVDFTVKAEDNVSVTEITAEYALGQEDTWVKLSGNYGRFTLHTNEMPDGQIRVRAYALDAAGNVSDPFVQTYLVDNTGPEQVTGLSHESSSVTLTLRWEDVADQDIGWFRVEQKQANGSYVTVADKITALGHNFRGLVPETEYTYRVTAFDTLGNAGMASEDYTASTGADTMAPVTAQLLPAPGSFNSRISISAAVQDDYSVASAALEYSSDGITWTQLCSETYKDTAASRKISGVLDLTDIPEGVLYIRATAADQAGNVSEDPAFVQHMVDKTAPAVPSGVSAVGAAGYVEIRWKSGTDVASYQIFRADTEDGEFRQIAGGHTSLNFFDRNVEDGATYWYKVAAVDIAGNSSELCAAVSATANADTQVPEIMSIAPVDGSVIGPQYAQVGVLAKDNSKLSSILVEYSHDGTEYAVLTQLTDINSYGDTVSGNIPVGEFSHGDTVWLRASAVDCAGNTSQPVVYTYTIDSEAPVISAFTAAYSEETVILNWTGGAEADLAGYRIYRRDAEGSSSLIGQVAAKAGQADYTWTDSSLPVTGGTFIYQIEAVDAVGNTATASSSGLEAPSVEIPARTGPQALLTCDAVMTQGVEYVIDGSGSADDGQIVSYTYDFGDGTTGSGRTVIHKYDQEGTYLLTLTVTDNDGQTHSVGRRITVKTPGLLGNVQVRIVDEKGTPVPNAPVYFDLGEENQVIRGTDANGYVTFTAEVGRHTVGCVIMNNEWLPVKRDLIVNAGQTTSVSMTLVNKPIVEGSFEIKRMTLEEIEAAGIDLTDPENQYYVEVELHLEYGNRSIDTTIPGGSLGGGGWPWPFPPIIIDPDDTWKPIKRDPDDPDPVRITFPDDDDDEDDEPRGWWPVLIEKSKDPKLMILDIPIGVQSLKEMFDVRLHILNNSSSEFSMLENVITLNTPNGLSVVTDAYLANQQTVYVPEIQGQTQTSVDWIVRGDLPGEYYLTADYSGILSQFNEPLTAQFEAGMPIEVYGMTGMKLILEVADKLENGTLYYNVVLKNEGVEDIYKPSIKTADTLIEMVLYDETGTITAEGQKEEGQTTVKSLKGLPDILGVGDSLIMHYMSIDQTEYTHCVMALEEQLVEYTNTYGLEDVEILVQPLDYFRQSLNTKVNPKQKAEETLNANASAYDQITDNNRYIYWAFANEDIEEHKLKKNIDEFTWTALRDGIAAAANGDDDEDQIQSLVLQVISLSADNVEQIEHANKVEFLDALRKVADILPLEDTLGAYASSFRASVDTSYMVMIKNDWIEMGGRPNALETMILTNWQEEILKEGLDPLDEQKARARIREVVADQRAASAWRAAGFAVEAAKQVQDMLKETSADIEWVMQAQATEEAFMVCLDAMIDGMKNHRLYFLRYEDSGTVRRNLIRIKSMVEEEGMLNVWLINLAEMLVQYGAEKLIEKGTDAVADAAGFGGLYGFLAKVFIKGGVVLSDYLGNISGQHDAADNIKFMAILSDAVSFGLEDARTAYISKRTTKTAAEYMQLLKLMIDLRAIGESQVALYGKSFETDYTVGNLPLLKAVRKATDAEEAMSWYQWRDIVEDRISALRVKLLRNPKTVEATGRVRPTVTFDYINSQTLQSFDNTFQYSLNKGGSWASCDGGPIAVERPETSTEIWVRKIDRKNTDMTETGMVTVYGAIALNPARIEVLKTEDGYRINGLDPERRYQVTFSEGTMTYDYDTVLETDLPANSISYSVQTDAVYNNVYIRALGDKTGYASEITRLRIVNEVSLNLYVTGQGIIGDDSGAYTYGDTVSLSAVPAEGRYFDGWYRNGTKLSSDPYYTFRIYGSMYLEARFLEIAQAPVPGVSGTIDALTASGTVTMEDGTVITVSGVPETADMLVVETITDAGVLNGIGGALEQIGTAKTVYDIYLLDAQRNRMEISGAAVTLDWAGDTAGILLCGVSGNYEATVLKTSAENGTFAFTGNGSRYYVPAALPADRSIRVQTNAWNLLPGQQAQLTAEFLPGNPTGTTVLWSLDQGDEAFATVKATGNTAVVTALNVTGGRDITVTASAADGSFPATSVKIRVVPFVHQLSIFRDGEDVTGKKISFDVNRASMLELTAVAAPADAVPELTWTSSDASIAEVTEGSVLFTGKTGTVKITAKANDGSGKTASVEIVVMALPQNVAMAEGSVEELVGGKSASFTAIDVDTGKTLSYTQFQWTLAEEYAPYASITVDGKLTTRVVSERTEIVITGAVLGNEDIAFVEHTVTLYPEVTYVEILHDGAVVNDLTIPVDMEYDLPTVGLDAQVYPGDAMGGITWKSSNAAIATVDENGVVTATGKAGKVTITARANDGSGIAASVKLNFAVFVKEIFVDAPAEELRSGSSMMLTAQTVPAAPTVSGVVWSLKNSDDSQYVALTSAGRLTAKTVYGEYIVTVVATAKDGSGVTAELSVLIRPKADGILTLYSGDQNVTRTTVNVDLTADNTLSLSAYTLGQSETEYVTWKSSNTSVASVEADDSGNAVVTVHKGGTATITARTEDGRTATVTVKGVKLTREVTITSQTGQWTLASGKSMTLKAVVTPADATVKTVVWSVADEDAPYASITAGGKLTAAENLQQKRTITVIAEAKDGGAYATAEVELMPLATGAAIFTDAGEALSNTTFVVDMTQTDTLQLMAKVYPLYEAGEDVIWKSSASRVASVDEYGTVTCLKAGTTVISATTTDGSKVKAQFKLTVVKRMGYLELPGTAVVAGGKSLTMTKLAGYLVDAGATNKTVIWSMEGEGAAYATLSSAGVLKTQKVTEPKTLTVIARSADGSELEAYCDVTIHPATTKVEVLKDGVPVTDILVLAVGQSLDLDGISQPVDAADAYTWKTASSKYVTVDEDGVVTVIAGGRTVSVTCTAADGSGRSAVVRIRTLHSANEVTLDFASQMTAAGGNP